MLIEEFLTGAEKLATPGAHNIFHCVKNCVIFYGHPHRQSLQRKYIAAPYFIAG